MLRYVEGNSFLHQLNSTVKLLLLVILSVIIFMIQNGWVLTVFLGMAFLTLLLTQIPIKYYIRHIRTAFYFILFTFVLNLLFSDILYSAMICYRLFIMLLFTLVFSICTKQMDLIKSIQNLAFPLKWCGINAKEIGIIVAIGLSFMSVLRREFVSIKQAQMAKGYYPNIVHLKKYCLSIFIPFLNNCFRRVDEISVALYVKGYQS